ncbi:MAG: hypothetical protein RMK81_15680, partial [Geminicoccaceae bacterium]|nr:hypothetical protein [Geminicoccaceae bacterium]
MDLLDRRRLLLFGAGLAGAGGARRARANGDPRNRPALDASERAALDRFLARQVGTPLWHGSAAAERRATALLAAIEGCEGDGL